MGRRGGMMLILAALLSCCGITVAILFPRDSSSRNSKSLDGVWNFKLSPKLDQDAGFRESWFDSSLTSFDDTIDMPVPSSYNDITINTTIRDYIGWAWYDREFYVSHTWKEERVMLRFGSVHYTAIIYINGKPVVSHSGGHLPFEADVSNAVRFSDKNRITVAVNNTLTRYTVPQGEYRWEAESAKYPAGYSTLEIAFDFFNYAGIHRPVLLYTTPKRVQIMDVTTSTTVSEDMSATLNFAVKYHINDKDEEDVQCVVTLYDVSTKVGEVFSCAGNMKLTSPHLWWPYLMSETPGYMYQLKISVVSLKYGIDEYTLPVGLREVTWGASSFMINHKPFYFRGFGRHEDSNIREGVGSTPVCSRHQPDKVDWSKLLQNISLPLC